MNTPTPTPRTDAAWSASFEGKQLSAGQTARSLRDCSQQLERELAALTAERDQLRADYERACQTVAQMHAAAVGEVCGPRRGIVEDLSDLRAERDQLRVDRYYNRKCINRLASATGTLGEKSEKVVEVALSTIDQLRARAERAEASLHAMRLVCGTTDADKFTTWVDRANARAEKAEAAETVALSKWNGALERAMKAEAQLAAEREKSERYRLATLKLDAELATERARLDSGTILLIVAGERVWHCGVDLRSAIDAAMKEGGA